MKHIFAISVLCMGAIFFQGCGPKVYTKGTYDDPNRVELLDDKFNEADMQQMADKIVQAIVNCPEIKDAKTRPSVAVSVVQNRTEEHIDVDSITEKIRTNLTKIRKVRFIDRSARGEIDEEMAYGDSGKVSRETKKKAGQQIAVDYLLKGAIATNIQEVSNDKFIFYKLTMDLVNTETSAVDCSEDHEVRKQFRKRSTGLF